MIRNVSAVTAACMMIRKAVFEEVKGFDEDKYKEARDIVLGSEAEWGKVKIYAPYGTSSENMEKWVDVVQGNNWTATINDKHYTRSMPLVLGTTDIDDTQNQLSKAVPKRIGKITYKFIVGGNRELKNIDGSTYTLDYQAL